MKTPVLCELVGQVPLWAPHPSCTCLSARQGPFRHFLDMKAEKRLASWKERRSRYGDINMHKCYPLGQVFTPFRALATTVSKLFFENWFPSPLETSDKCQLFPLLWDGWVSSGRTNAAPPTTPKLSDFQSQGSAFLTRWSTEKQPHSTFVSCKLLGWERVQN